MVQTLRHLVVFWDVSQNASHLSKALISLSNDGLAKKKSDCCRCCCIIQGWFRNQKTSSVRVIKWGHFSGQNTNAHTEPKVLKFFLSYIPHGLWKSQKKSHSALRAKRATVTFWVDKSLLKMPKILNFATKSFGQTVLPDRSLISGQKLMENA